MHILRMFAFYVLLYIYAYVQIYIRDAIKKGDAASANQAYLELKCNIFHFKAMVFELLNAPDAAKYSFAESVYAKYKYTQHPKMTELRDAASKNAYNNIEDAYKVCFIYILFTLINNIYIYRKLLYVIKMNTTGVLVSINAHTNLIVYVKNGVIQNQEIQIIKVVIIGKNLNQQKHNKIIHQIDIDILEILLFNIYLFR